MSALDVQVGGDHYKKYKIQPMEYSMANGLDACQHTAIKYITRFRDKGGIADLEKAKHCIDLLIEFERQKMVYPTQEIAADAAAGLHEIDFPASEMNSSLPSDFTEWKDDSDQRIYPVLGESSVDVIYKNGRKERGVAKELNWREVIGFRKA